MLIRELRQARPESRLIWATITPVRTDNSLGATNARLDARNALALTLMEREGIPVDDQHALMQDHGDLHLDDVHFNDKGSEFEGDQAAAGIEAALAPAMARSPR